LSVTDAAVLSFVFKGEHLPVMVLYTARAFIEAAPRRLIKFVIVTVSALVPM
jgi:hypothetical protein